MTISEIQQKSLFQLEPVELTSELDSVLVKKCNELYSKKLCDYTVKDLRLMIGQEIGLKCLTPIALEQLYTNPFVGGDYYYGDLLVSILKVNQGFWKKHQSLYYELVTIIAELPDIMQRILTPISRFQNPL